MPTIDEAPELELKTIEQWAEKKKTDPAMFAVAKAITPGWGIGRECNEATFDEALDRAGNLTFR